MRNSLCILLASILLVGCSNGRSLGNKIDDKFLAPDVKSAISEAHPELSRPESVISTASYNGIILLVGQTTRADLKQLAGRTAQSVPGVKLVHNEITVQPPVSGLVRANDSLLTSKIKAQLVADSEASASKVKVITENGTAYLMGIVSRSEADAITDVTRQVSGVQRIVRLFEYTD